MSNGSKIIRDGFTNIEGKHYPNIREVIVSKNKKGMLEVGEFIEETGEFNISNYSEDGIHIFRSREDKNIGYRIYREFALPSFNGNGDDILISKLQERQKDITKTKFPTGVVTFEGRILGQEIPFYGDSVTISKHVCKTKKQIEFETYHELIDILKELRENDIYYCDVHGGNFMINNITNKIDIIDFVDHKIIIGSNSRYAEKVILNNLKSMVYKLEKLATGECVRLISDSCKTLEEAEESLYDSLSKRQLTKNNGLNKLVI